MKLLVVLWLLSTAAVHGARSTNTGAQAHIVGFNYVARMSRQMAFYSEHYYVTWSAKTGKVRRYDLLYRRDAVVGEERPKKLTVQVQSDDTCNGWIHERHLVLLRIGGGVARMYIVDLETMSLAGSRIKFPWRETQGGVTSAKLDNDRVTLFSQPNITFQLRTKARVKWLKREGASEEYIPRYPEPPKDTVVAVALDAQRNRTLHFLKKAMNGDWVFQDRFHFGGIRQAIALLCYEIQKAAFAARDPALQARSSPLRAELPFQVASPMSCGEVALQAIYGVTSTMVFSATTYSKRQVPKTVRWLSPYVFVPPAPGYSFDPWTGKSRYLTRHGERVLVHTKRFVVTAEANKSGSAEAACVAIYDVEKNMRLLSSALKADRLEQFHALACHGDHVIVYNSKTGELVVTVEKFVNRGVRGLFPLSKVSAWSLAGPETLLATMKGGFVRVYSLGGEMPALLPLPMPPFISDIHKCHKVTMKGEILILDNSGSLYRWTLPTLQEQKMSKLLRVLSRRPKPAPISGPSPLLQSGARVDNVVALDGFLMASLNGMRHLVLIQMDAAKSEPHFIDNPFFELESHKDVQFHFRGPGHDVVLITTSAFNYSLRFR